MTQKLELINELYLGRTKYSIKFYNKMDETKSFSLLLTD